MQLDHRRIGSQHVTEPLQHAAIAHITRRELVINCASTARNIRARPGVNRS